MGGEQNKGGEEKKKGKSRKIEKELASFIQV